MKIKDNIPKNYPLSCYGERIVLLTLATATIALTVFLVRMTTFLALICVSMLLMFIAGTLTGLAFVCIFHGFKFYLAQIINPYLYLLFYYVNLDFRRL